VSLPSQLIEQRPMCAPRKAQLHQASAAIGVAEANRLPQFNLTGDYGSAALTTATLFTPSTIIWSVRRPAARSRSSTAFSCCISNAPPRPATTWPLRNTSSTVLAAFQNVADALRALQLDAATLKAQRAPLRRIRHARSVARPVQARRHHYVILLNAQRSYQQARLAVVQAQAARYADTAALFQALGGGWWNRIDVAPDPYSPDDSDDRRRARNRARHAGSTGSFNQ
jgi:outer membrane protein TolC